MSARVERGIAFLDEHAEPGWRERIDLSTLDLVNCRACVLGQLYGTYHRALDSRKLGLSETKSVRCGFTLRSVNEDASDWAWARLTDEWKEALAEKEKGP